MGGILFREYCFGEENSLSLTEFLGQTRWVLRRARWVRVYTQIIGWKELTEFAPGTQWAPKNSPSSVFETVLPETVFGPFPKNVYFGQFYANTAFLGPATTQNLVVKFDGEICGGVLVENSSDDFPSKRSSKISCQTSPKVRHQLRRKLRRLHSGNRWCLLFQCPLSELSDTQRAKRVAMCRRSQKAGTPEKKLQPKSDSKLTFVGNGKCARSFFAQTFWTPPGVRDIPAKFPGHPGFLSSKPKEDKVSRAGTKFLATTPSRGRPPPHRAVSGPKNLIFVLFFLAWFWGWVRSNQKVTQSNFKVAFLPRFSFYPWVTFWLLWTDPLKSLLSHCLVTFKEQKKNHKRNSPEFSDISLRHWPGVLVGVSWCRSVATAPFCYTPFFRVFLNPRFAEPMVCMRVAFHENDGDHENDENDEHYSDNYKQGVECWIRGNQESSKPRRSRVQTTGSPNHRFRDTLVCTKPWAFFCPQTPPISAHLASV